MSKETFKMIDISLFSIIAIVLEVAIYFGSRAFKSELPIFVSFSIVLSLIAIYRWGILGSAVAICGGLASAIIQNMYGTAGIVNNNLYLIYGLGNAFVALSYLLLLKPGRKKISSNTVMLVGYELFGYIAVIIGRSVISVILDGAAFTSYILGFLAPESLGFVIGIIILIVANKPNGVLVEMNEYIRNIHEEMSRDKLHLKEIKESNSYDAIGDVTNSDKINDASLLEGGNLDQHQLDELQLMYDEALGDKNNGRKELNDGKDD